MIKDGSNARPRKLDEYREDIAALLRDNDAVSAREVWTALRPKADRLAEATVRKYLADFRDEIIEENGRREAEAETARPQTPPDPTPLPERTEAGQFDLDDPRCFLNRELTWLNFNYRVLHEAEDERTPLLDRLKFIAIVSSNLDEFFMKRIGGLKQQVGAGIHEPSLDGRTPQEQIEAAITIVRDLETRKRQVLLKVIDELKEHDINLVRWDELGEDDKAALREHYITNIYPLVTPQATDPAHPFPFISNLSINLLVNVRYPGDASGSLARVKVPVGAGIPRLLQVPGRNEWVRMESVMAQNLDLLFPGMEIEGYSFFRVTRNANTETDEENAEDLLSMIESELRERKFAPIVRLEVNRGMEPLNRGMLAAELGLDENIDVFEVEGMLGMRDLMELVGLDRPALKDPAHHPTEHPALTTDREIFHTIRDAGSIMLHHPYQSFATSVERFLREASEDPKVRAIKMTLYRTSADSKAIPYLINAARNGKQVAVVVELKARFDEAANIRWASRMEEVGIHVTYGVVGLKTHCKTILVVRQDYDGLRRYAHVGTGNYHAGTARLYSDIGILTSDPGIGAALTELLNYLTTGYKPKRNYGKLLVAPKTCKQQLLAKIDREIKLHAEESPGLIQIKVNALEDADVTRALYRASQAGVHVDLLIRDSCRLRPGIEGLSENVTVIGIVGRFLEHARIYYFRNGGDEEYYIGSADCMKRNLESRVELLAPVLPENMREELRYFIDLQVDDKRNAWEMQPDGSFVQRVEGDQGCQQEMIDWAERRRKKATRLRRRKPKGFDRRNLR
ncbi:MAG: polyphosphate kinase 1 [Planctomycetota bacterium]